MEPLEVPRKDWRNLVALGISALGILYFLVQAISLSALLLIGIFNSQIDAGENTLIGLMVWYSIVLFVLLIPVFLFSLYDYREKPIPAWLDTRQPKVKKRLLWSILFLPVIMVIGWIVVGQPTLSVFILGFINVLVAGIPVLWMSTVAQWQLEGGSQARKWRIFGFSLTIMPVLVIFIEILVILLMAVFGGLWIVYRSSINPQLESEFMFIVNQLSLSMGDLDRTSQLLEPYILQPSVIFWGFAIFSGIIPLIEEIIKPIALWSLAGRNISPEEGFVGGLLCGAGFALMENLLYLRIVVSAEEWLIMSIGRTGTVALHMLASGLVGWGLVKTWREGKWLPLIMTTVGSFLLHGIWNAMALLSGVIPLVKGNLEVTPKQTLFYNLPLILLFFTTLISIFLINRYFRKGTIEHISKTQTSIEEEGIVDEVS